MFEGSTLVLTTSQGVTVRDLPAQITTASYTFAREHVKEMREFLQNFLPHGIVYSERWRFPLHREFVITGPADVMDGLRFAMDEIQQDLRVG
jgi:hypothetical protein